jgi:CheY-like chemotaxis protein
MPQGGRLTLQTRIVELTEAELHGKDDAKPGRHISLRVQDDGCGIPQDILSRVFEPFFTTKEVGKGTGLGLATVFGIVKQHHGWLEVDSTVGAGTCFTLSFPILKSSSSVPPETSAPDRPVAGGRETILIVEDESSVREFAVAVLKPLGYRILQARSGLDALEVWKWHSARINLLLTDMVMPDDLNGPELAAKLLTDKPDLAVIFTSGYSQETMRSVFAPAKTKRFIHKPYSPRQLSTVVREALDAKGVSATMPVLSS